MLLVWHVTSYKSNTRESLRKEILCHPPTLSTAPGSGGGAGGHILKGPENVRSALLKKCPRVCWYEIEHHRYADTYVIKVWIASQHAACMTCNVLQIKYERVTLKTNIAPPTHPKQSSRKWGVHMLKETESVRSAWLSNCSRVCWYEIEHHRYAGTYVRKVWTTC